MAQRLFQAIGRLDLVGDSRFSTNASRVNHAGELDALIGAFIAQRTQAENVTFFEQAEVTIGPVYDISQIVEDPHVIEREVVADHPDSDMESLPMHHEVPRFMGTPASIRTSAPLLGEHNRELLRESVWMTQLTQDCSPLALQSKAVCRCKRSRNEPSCVSLGSHMIRSLLPVAQGCTS